MAPSRGKHVGGAADTQAATVENVGIDHGGADVVMAEELLHRPDVIAGFKEMGSERMPERVTRGPLGDSGPQHGVPHGALNRRWVEMMPPALGARAVDLGARRREHPLPSPLHRRARRLDLQRALPRPAAAARGYLPRIHR